MKIILTTVPFNVFNSSIPPKLTSEIFHNNNKTFFIGKWRAEPAQNLVIIPNSFTDNNSSPIGASKKYEIIIN